MRPPEADPIVDAAGLVPGLIVDVRYARADNPFGRPIYARAVFALRRSVAGRLAEVAAALAPRGYRLIGYDGYRPLSAQRLLWELCPVRGYVAPPEAGSNHNRGSAADVGLASAAGQPLPMPSDYDDFSARAHHDYAGSSAAAREHRVILRQAMLAAGFTDNRMEWWHYDAPDPRRWPVEDLPLEAIEAGT